MWTVVEFKDEELVEVVPVSWVEIENEICWWPTAKVETVLKLVEREIRPFHDTKNLLWKKHKVRVMGKNRTSLMEARADRNRAQTESNLESEATEQSQLRPQRRVRRRLMQVNSSSEDEENAADTYSVLSPPPPPPQEQLYEPLFVRRSPRKHQASSRAAQTPYSKTASTSLKKTSTFSLYAPSSSRSPISPPEPTIRHQASTSLKKTSTFSLYTPSSSHSPISPPEPTIRHQAPTSQSLLSMPSTSRSPILPPEPTIRHPAPTSQSPLSMYGPASTSRSPILPLEPTISQQEFQKEVFRKLNHIILLQKNQQLCIDQLVQAQVSAAPPPTPAVLPELAKHLQEWPHEHLALFKAFDEVLKKDKQLKQQVIQHLSRKGGKKASDIVKRILHSVMKNSLMDKFSWVGFKGKEKFCQLELKNVIIAAVHLNPTTQHCTEAELEASVKAVLKHAKWRDTKEPQRRDPNLRAQPENLNYDFDDVIVPGTDDEQQSE